MTDLEERSLPRRGPERAAALAGRAREALQHGTDWLQDGNGQELRKKVEDQIRLRPLLALGLAVIAGFALGRTLRD